MSALWGAQTQRQRLLFMFAALIIPLAGCQYVGPIDEPVQKTLHGSTEPTHSFLENLDEVARLLEVSKTDHGMQPAPWAVAELSTDLAPGDYLIRSACSGDVKAELTIVLGEGLPERTGYSCDSMVERFIRHPGGPVIIIATPATGKPEAAAGVALKPNSNPMASELEDMRVWDPPALKPALPGERAGSASSTSTMTQGILAEPGNYELHFLCERTSEVELSISTWAGAAVLEPVRVRCDGNVLKASVRLATEGADFTMDPDSGAGGRYAFRLVPSGPLS